MRHAESLLGPDIGQLIERIVIARVFHHPDIKATTGKTFNPPSIQSGIASSKGCNANNLVTDCKLIPKGVSQDSQPFSSVP